MFPIDQKLPTLNGVLQGDAIAHALRAQAPEFLPEVIAGSCNVTRFRYRQSKRAIVLYEARAEDDQNPRRLFAGYLYAGDKGERIAKGLSRKQSGAHGNSSSKPSHAYLKDQKLLLLPFPYDHKMPGLAQFLSSLSSSSLRIGPDRRCLGALSNPDVMRYRPGLRATVRVEVNQSKSSSTDKSNLMFVKFSAEEDAGTAVRQQTRYARQLGRPNQGLTIDAPIAKCGQTGAVIYAHATGRTLQDEAGLHGNYQRMAEISADAIHRLHTAEAEGLPAANSERMARRLTRAASLIAWACPDTAPLSNEIVANINQQFSSLQARPVHGDLKPEHIFVDGEQVTLIDNESIELGDPAFDLGRLLARLEVDESRTKTNKIESLLLARAFLERYASISEARELRNLSVGLAVGRLRLALHWLQGLYPNWQNGVRAQVNHAHRAILRKDISAGDIGPPQY